jgi:hypothetical protein
VLIEGKALGFARTEGAELLARYDIVREKLSAPILVHGLRRVVEEATRIDRVQLFASDQPRSSVTDEKHWRRDTVELGRILQRLLKDVFGERVGHVDCCLMQRNPADYDQANAFFAEQLRRQVPPADFDAVWIAPVGGAPASNTGLLLNAIRIYRKRCQLIYVPEDERVQAQTLDLHREILHDYAREEVAAHLAKRDFVALRNALLQCGLGSPWQIALCDYADCRLRFDFAGASAALEQAQDRADGALIRSRIDQCRVSLSPLLDHNGTVQPDSSSPDAQWIAWFKLQRACLAELYFNLRLKVLRAEWVDFLGRLFRLNEAALRLTFEMATRHSTEKVGRAFPDFAEAIDADVDLVEHFNNRGASRKSVDTHVLRTWLDFQAGRDPAGHGSLPARFDRIRGLSQLRNKSILAHGYQGVAREAIEAVLMQPVQAFVDGDLRDILVHFGAPVTDDDDPFRAVVGWLEEV